jgi:hypothetical protein
LREDDNLVGIPLLITTHDDEVCHIDFVGLTTQEEVSAFMPSAKILLTF